MNTPGPLTGRIIAAAAMLGISVLTLLPSAERPEVSHGCVICGFAGGVDAILNVLLFVPLGAGLALSGLRFRGAVLGMSAFSLSIELLQIVAVPGRYGTIADVITNSAGGILGFFAGRYGPACLRPSRRTASALTSAWLGLWLILQLVVAYAFMPVPGEPPYHAIITRADRHSGLAFPGTFVGGSFGSESLAPGPLANGDRLRALYMSSPGVVFETRVLPGELSPDRREIAVIAGPAGGIASFEQERGDLVFAARTGADAMRLRTLWFRLRGVFPSSRSTDTITLHAQYGREAVLLRSEQNRTVNEQRFVHRLSSGWMVFSPLIAYADGDAADLVMSVVYVVVMLLPAGYWARSTYRAAAQEPRLRFVVFAVLVSCLALGLVALPMAFGLRPASALEWMASGVGIAAGAALRRAISWRRIPPSI